MLSGKSLWHNQGPSLGSKIITKIFVWNSNQLTLLEWWGGGETLDTFIQQHKPRKNTTWNYIFFLIGILFILIHQLLHRNWMAKTLDQIFSVTTSFKGINQIWITYWIWFLNRKKNIFWHKKKWNFTNY